MELLSNYIQEALIKKDTVLYSSYIYNIIYTIIYTWITMPDTDELGKSDRDLQILEKIINTYIEHYNINQIKCIYYISDQVKSCNAFYHDLLKKWKDNNLLQDINIEYKRKRRDISEYDNHWYKYEQWPYYNIKGIKVEASEYGLLFDTEYDSIFIVY